MIKTKTEFEAVIRELNARLKEQYSDFSGITFFGSRNRGDFRKDSDFDIVVLFATKPLWKIENDVLDLIYETELKYNFVIDAKVYQESEIKECNTPFRETVLTEGTFYAA